MDGGIGAFWSSQWGHQTHTTKMFTKITNYVPFNKMMATLNTGILQCKQTILEDLDTTLQITHNLNSTRMSHTCDTREQKQKTCMALNHACTCVWNKCTTHTHLSIQSICHQMILLTTNSASSFIIYACRTILGGIVIDIIGHMRHSICSSL